MSLSNLFVTLGFKVDEQQVKSAEKALNRIDDAVSKINRNATRAGMAVAGLMTVSAKAGAETEHLANSLGMSVQQLDAMDKAAKTFGSDMKGILSNLRSQIDASFEGGASSGFYRFIGQASDVEDAYNKIFAAIEGRGNLEQRNILSQLGISGVDQNVFLQGKQAFEKQVQAKMSVALNKGEGDAAVNVVNSLDGLWQNINKLGLGLLVENQGKILTGVNTANDLLTENRDDVVQAISDIPAGMKAVFDRVIADNPFYSNVLNGIRKMGEFLNSLGGGLGKLVGMALALSLLTKTLGKIAGSITDLIRMYKASQAAKNQRKLDDNKSELDTNNDKFYKRSVVNYLKAILLQLGGDSKSVENGTRKRHIETSKDSPTGKNSGGKRGKVGTLSAALEGVGGIEAIIGLVTSFSVVGAIGVAVVNTMIANKDSINKWQQETFGNKINEWTGKSDVPIQSVRPQSTVPSYQANGFRSQGYVNNAPVNIVVNSTAPAPQVAKEVKRVLITSSEQ